MSINCAQKRVFTEQNSIFLPWRVFQKFRGVNKAKLPSTGCRCRSFSTGKNLCSEQASFVCVCVCVSHGDCQSRAGFCLSFVYYWTLLEPKESALKVESTFLQRGWCLMFLNVFTVSHPELLPPYKHFSHESTRLKPSIPHSVFPSRRQAGVASWQRAASLLWCEAERRCGIIREMDVFLR